MMMHPMLIEVQLLFYVSTLLTSLNAFANVFSYESSYVSTLLTSLNAFTNVFSYESRFIILVDVFWTSNVTHIVMWLTIN